ncbi:hypothetical protein ['Camptotheca acuminata' phytoplasma]|uniref:hypothetical protein n=1 Tax='Camptotheca acuminata' phytoplasma TaxID=3239192 RepID=UPI00351A6D93
MRIKEKYSKFQNLFILLIFFLIYSNLSFNFVLGYNYFHKRIQMPVHLPDYKNIKKEWLETQPKTIKHDIYILEPNNINVFLKEFNDQINYFNSQIPCYNAPEEKNLIYSFRNPPKGLIGVYLKYRYNIFKEKYPSKNNFYTLEEILENDVSISEAFVFWDQKETEIKKENYQTELVELEIDNEKDIPNIINNFLKQKNIISNSDNIFIKLGHYNIAPKKGTVAPIPYFNIFNNQKIEIVYFNKGFRILQTLDKNNIYDLLKLSNGANQIYLFSFKRKNIKFFIGTVLPRDKMIRANDKDSIIE